jgi:hypothetical protein
MFVAFSIQIGLILGVPMKVELLITASSRSKLLELYSNPPGYIPPWSVRVIDSIRSPLTVPNWIKEFEEVAVPSLLTWSKTTFFTVKFVPLRSMFL